MIQAKIDSLALDSAVPSELLRLSKEKVSDLLLARFIAPGILSVHLVQQILTGTPESIGITAVLLVFFSVFSGGKGYVEFKVSAVIRELEPQFAELWTSNALEKAQRQAIDLAARYKEGDTRLESYRLDILRYRHGNALLHHLGKYSILAADVPTVGFARLEALHRMGILTAADLKRENFEQGMWTPLHVDELMTWRNAIELQFWATSSYTLSDAEEEDIRNKVASEQSQIEKQLKAAPKELEKLRDDIEERRRRLIDEFHRELQPLRKSRLFRGAFKRLNGYELPDMSGERSR
jgi:uncharacterized protein YlxW (UPF0749 family)